MLNKTLSAAAAAALVGAAGAQTFTYPDFTSSVGLQLNGNAVIPTSELRLTSAVISEKGSAFYDSLVPVASGFDTTFTFQITQQASGGGDGMAFIVQADPRGAFALGNHAAAMGYGAFLTAPAGTAIAKSLAVEIDTYQNGNWGDTNGNGISVHTGGAGDNSQDEAYSIGGLASTINLSDGQPHQLRVRYVPGTLDVFLDDLVNPLLTITYDIVTGGTYTSGAAIGGLGLGAGGLAYVGFTAGNGGAWENHDVLDWTFDGGSLGMPVCQSVAANSTGTTGLLTITGSAQVSANSLSLEASNLPASAFGFFLTSRTSGFVANPGGSAGNLCLGGSIGRYVGPGQIQNTGTAGAFSLTVDLTQVPQPTGAVVAVAGDVWIFQAWHRDAVGGQATSNFTEARAVTFN